MQETSDANRMVGLTGKYLFNISAKKGETSTYLADLTAVGTTVTIVRATPTGWITEKVILAYNQLFLNSIKDQSW